MEKEAALFKALSDPTRLRLMALLAVQGETCVCKLVEALNEPQFKISRHLGVLRAAGIVKARREGAWMHYQLTAPRNKLEVALHHCFRDCLAEHTTTRKDLKRLKCRACNQNASST